MTYELVKSYAFEELNTLSVVQLELLAASLRQRILEVVSSNGGH
ncbi:hypothetical protein, partial [uncultured Helicobacter sp.]